MIIVRPDQYVAKVTTLDDFAGIAKIFAGFLIAKGDLTSKSAKGSVKL